MSYLRKIGEEPRHLGLAHLGRMSLSMKQDEPARPSDIRLLGLAAEVPQTRTRGEAPICVTEDCNKRSATAVRSFQNTRPVLGRSCPEWLGFPRNDPGGSHHVVRHTTELVNPIGRCSLRLPLWTPSD